MRPLLLLLLLLSGLLLLLLLLLLLRRQRLPLLLFRLLFRLALRPLRTRGLPINRDALCRRILLAARPHRPCARRRLRLLRLRLLLQPPPPPPLRSSASCRRSASSCFCRRARASFCSAAALTVAPITASSRPRSYQSSAGRPSSHLKSQCAALPCSA